MIATRERPGSLARTLDHLRALPEAPPVVIVDNGSTAGPPAELATPDGRVAVLGLPENRGAAARTHGARAARTPYVAFSDDDSWWAPGALERAAALLRRHPRLALVAARVLVGPEQRLDPTCAEMRRSPLRPQPGLPGRPVLGFIACGAVVRGSAFLAVGGFERRLGVGGEEELLAYDLADAGFALAYCDEVVAYHDPSPTRDPERRRAVQMRNRLWSAWLRRSRAQAMSATGAVARSAVRERAARRALREALAELPWALDGRRPVAPAVEAAARTLGM